MKWWLGLLLLSPTLLSAEITHSVMPHFEQLETFNREKYGPGQLQEIEKALARKEDAVRVMSYNMLSITQDKNIPEIHHWHNRLPRLVELLDHIQADLIGTQELLQSQIDELTAALGDTYAFYGEPQADGQVNGFLYRPERFEVMEQIVLQLEGECALTILGLRDRRTDTDFVAMNIHLPSRYPDKRERYVRQLVDIVSHTSLPTILTGDFNTFANRPLEERLRFLDGPYLEQLLTSGRLTEASQAPLLGSLGPLSTLTIASNSESKETFAGEGIPGFILDHIYVSRWITTLIHAVEPARVDGHFPSDHMPLVADLLLG